MTSRPGDRNGILLYEDDAALANEMVAAFAEADYDVTHAVDEADFRKAVHGGQATALVLDRMIGSKDSLDMLTELRSNGDRVPVIVISSLSSVDERIRGLKAGGDDYLVKPFAMGELVARVSALQRRAADDRRIRLKVGPLDMDLIARSVRRGERVLDLLPREFTLLEYMMRHANHVVTRSMLLEDVWNYSVATQTNVVDVHVGNLRRKVDAEHEVRLITSVRGVGFMLAA